MSELTQAQVNAIQGLTTNVDLTYKTLLRSRTALSYLIGHGQATCNDVKTYNAQVQSTYFYQKAVADIIRAQGGTAPQVQPPVYVAWAGKTGDAAIDINCEAGGLHGWRPVAGALGDFYIDPSKVEWKQEPAPADTANVAKLVALAGQRAQPANGNQLGNPLLLAIIPLLLWGIIIYVAGRIILSIVEALTDVPGKQEYTRQVAISAERHAAVLEARQKCLADCLARGGAAASQENCSKNCARLITEYKPPAPNESLGLVGKVIIGVAAIGAVVVGVGLFRHYMNSSGGSHHGGGDDSDDLDGPYGYADDDEYEEDDSGAIDAEYTEHVPTSHRLEA